MHSNIISYWSSRCGTSFCCVWQILRCQLQTAGRLIAVVALVISAISVSAQDSPPIIFDFEDATCQAKWSLNVGDANIVSRLANRWCFTSAEQFVGEKSLVMSNKYNDAVPTSTYNNTATDVVVVASTVLSLPRGNFDLSFAWKCVGEQGLDGLYVIWEPDAKKLTSSMSGISLDYQNRAMQFGTRKMLCQRSTWQVERTTINSDGTQPYHLAFIWVNNGSNAYPPAACVDFVQISRQLTCTDVTNVAVSSNVYSTRISCTWQGVADSYQLMYRRFGDTSTPQIVDNITTHSYSVDVNTAGLYDFFVRGVCGTDTGLWMPYRNHLVYFPGCIDYANLNSDKCVCRHNIRNHDDFDEGRGPSGAIPPIDQSTWVKGIVDFGPDAMESRHTVHTLPEYDPRTNYKLPMVYTAGGDVASVRLGNWDTGAEGESVTYTITADSIYRIVLLNYAVVFQDPGHDQVEQPYFTLKIRDSRGNELSGVCGKEDFRPNVNLGANEGWHKETFSTAGGTDVVRWKEWTTVGVLIPESEIGNAISIELKTYDCEQGGHYGYAYFSLSCVPATITGIACGTPDEQNISAPSGFSYEWYLDDPNDPNDQNNVLFTTQSIKVDGLDTRTYFCDCNFLTKDQKKLDSCGFTLSANLSPRLPKASSIFQYLPSKCTNNSVKFNNVSAVVSDGGIPMGGELCDYYRWEIVGVDEDSIHIPLDRNPIVNFPIEGGDYTIRLISGITQGNCMDTLTLPYHVPSLVPKETWVDTTACGKYPFRWNGRTYTESSLDTVSYMMTGGCDSVIYLNLTITEAIVDTIVDTICQGETYHFYDQVFRTSQEYTKVLPAANKSNCDSTILLRLTVIDSVSIDVLPMAQVCADDTEFVLKFEWNQGAYRSLFFDFDEHSEAAGFADVLFADTLQREFTIPIPEDVRPDRYSVNMCFARDCDCDSLVRPVEFTVMYPTDVLAQKWNNVIAVLNADYNGGNSFTAFRWYEGEQLLVGEERPYLYIGENVKFDYSVAVQYSADLMREGENYYIRTCPITPAQRTDVSQYVTLSSAARVGQRIEVSLPDGDKSQHTAYWYTSGGQLVGRQTIDSLSPSVAAPLTAGIYLLKIESTTDTQLLKVVVR